MNTNQQIMNLEDQMVEWVALLFRNHVGHDVDYSEIKRHAQAVYTNAETMAPSYREDPDAWSLLSRIIREAKLTPINLEIRTLSEQYLTFEDILLDGKPVTPYALNQYLYREDNPGKRHEILSRFTKGHPELDQAWAHHRSKQTELAAEWKYTPLDDFLLSEGLDVAQLRRLLMEMATAFHSAFEARFAENRASVLGDNQGEPWEDFVTLYMNRWSVYVDQHIPLVDGVKMVRRLARIMGFTVDAIAMDLEDRPRKIPGCSAWDVHIPEDVRISVKPVGNVEDLWALFHEMGHALHFATVDPSLPFHIRYGFSDGIAETFSFWLDSLLGDSTYLEELGLNEQQASEMIRFRHLLVATFATWLSVQSLCVVDYWTEGPLTLEQLGERLSHYMKQFMGLTVPVEAIRALPTFVRPLNFNTVGYPVAYARLGHLLDQLESKQRDWWHVPKAVDIVRSYMRGGRNAGFPLSMLDIDPFVQRYRKY